MSLQTLHILGSQDFDDRSICCLSFSKADGGNLLCVVDDVEHNISGGLLVDSRASNEGYPKVPEDFTMTE